MSVWADSVIAIKAAFGIVPQEIDKLQLSKINLSVWWQGMIRVA